uniref:Interleukin 20 receptor subunit alpha n=1 Tax=Podarcis muralis TaxID=64176 RepID=A0A670I564_PODMU
MHIDKWWHPYCPHMLTCLFFPTALRCTLPSPRNVHFVSRNLKNVLHWLPPEGIPEDKLIYSVKYGTTRWIQDAECRNISQTWCDLSRGTSDHKELYHARVKAFLNGSCSSWTESPRFNPLTDSKETPKECYVFIIVLKVSRGQIASQNSCCATDSTKMLPVGLLILGVLMEFCASVAKITSPAFECYKSRLGQGWWSWEGPHSLLCNHTSKQKTDEGILSQLAIVVFLSLCTL